MTELNNKYDQAISDVGTKRSLAQDELQASKASAMGNGKKGIFKASKAIVKGNAKNYFT